ncbi:MAG: pyridoxamine 5-phosphate oxidase-like FMN-binding protein [Clostridia bacterium]|nr:pyridoxamine 5-phosphate oxidase-like FMN-binding protein [Clostridia bacterium]
MRRKDREITDQTEIKAIMEEAMVCRLGLCDGSEPYVVPLSFGIEGDTLYVHSAQEGRKIDIIKKNNTVCFEAETHTELVKGEIPCNWTMNYCSVIGKGKAYILEDPEEKKKGLDCIMKKYSKEDSFAYSDSMLNRVAVIKIKIEESSGKQRQN